MATLSPVASPFDAIINQSVGSTALPNSVAPDYHTQQQRADAELATAEQNLKAGPGGGLSGLAGDLAVAKKRIVDPGMSAITNFAKLMSDREKVQQMVNELEAAGLDQADIMMAKRIMGDGKDPDKVMKVWTDYLEPRLKQVRSEDKISEILADETVKENLARINAELEMADTKLEGDVVQNRIDTYEAERRAKQLREDALRKFVSTIYAIPGIRLSDEDIKTIERMGKSLISTQSKGAGAPKAISNRLISHKRLNSMYGVANYLNSVANYVSNTNFTQYLTVENLDKFAKEYTGGKYIPAKLAATPGYLYKAFGDDKHIIPVIGEDGSKSAFIGMGSNEGQNFMTSLAPIVNDYIRARLGGVVTRVNMLRVMQELGLGEFAKFDVQSMEAKDKTGGDPQSMYDDVKDMVKQNARYISVKAVLDSLRNTAKTRKEAYEVGERSMDNEIWEYNINESKEVRDAYNKLIKAKYGDLDYGGKDEYVFVEREPFTYMSNSLEAIRTTVNILLNKTNEQLLNDFTKVQEQLGKMEGKREGYKVAEKLLIEVSDAYGKNIQEYARLDEAGKLKAKDQYVKTADELFKKPYSSLTNEEKGRLAAVMTVLGNHEAAGYVIGGEAMFEQAKETWRIWKTGESPNTTSNLQPQTNENKKMTVEQARANAEAKRLAEEKAKKAKREQELRDRLRR